MTSVDFITRDPEILGGIPVFTGTRVPIETLLTYLKAGGSLQEFLEDFPSVQQEQAEACLELAKEAILDDARAA